LGEEGQGTSGIADVKDCNACHGGNPKKGGELTARGKFLMDTKAKKKAARVRYGLAEGYKGK